MYTELMNKSLELNQRFIDSISFQDLDAMMSEFDTYVVNEERKFFDYINLEKYLVDVYSKYELFKKFEGKDRKSVTLENKNIEKDLINGPFLFNLAK